MNWWEFGLNLALFIAGWLLKSPLRGPKPPQANPFFPPQRRWNDPGNPDSKKDTDQ